MEIVLPFCRSPVARHNWSFAILVMMVVSPLANFLVTQGDRETLLVSGLLLAAQPDVATSSSRWLEWVVMGWLAGAGFMGLRTLGGWYCAERLRHQDTSVVPADLLQRFCALQRRLRIGRPIRYLLSARVTAPLVIGWIRPIILVPAAAVTGLPVFQLEALIVHELAHIRRLDPLLNLLLIAAETFLFYHPAVWWVTRRIRIEREHCCDDVSADFCGDPAGYAEALISIQELRRFRRLAVASNGGDLRQRVTRLLGMTSEPRRFSGSALCGVLLLCIIAGSIAMAGVPQGVEIRIIDQTVAANSTISPPGDDRVPVGERATGVPGAFWLKRQGAIAGDVVSEAHVSTGPDGKPMIGLTLTPQAREGFASLSRANVGSRAAIVFNGVVVASPVIKEPMLEGKVQISGNYTQAEANALASELMAAGARTR